MSPVDPHADLVRGLRAADAAFTAVPVSADVERRVRAVASSPASMRASIRAPRARFAFASAALVTACAALFLVLRDGDSDGPDGVARIVVAPRVERAAPVVLVDATGARALATGSDIGDIGGIEGDEAVHVALLPLDGELALVATPWGELEAIGASFEVLVAPRELTVVSGHGTLARDGAMHLLALGDRVRVAGAGTVASSASVVPVAQMVSPLEVVPKGVVPKSERFDLTREIRAVQDLVLQGKLDAADARIGVLMARTSDVRARRALSAERVQLRAHRGFTPGARGDVCAALAEHAVIAGALGPDLAALAAAKGCAP